MTDDYKQTIPGGCEYIQGQFLEKIESNNKGIMYRLETKKKTFFYTENVVFPFVQFTNKKKGFFIAMEEYVDVLNIVENLQEA